jgi:hypothetical protein
VILLIAVNDSHRVLCKFSHFDRSATNAAALMTVVNAVMELQLSAGDSADDSGSAFKVLQFANSFTSPKIGLQCARALHSARSFLL